MRKESRCGAIFAPRRYAHAFVSDLHAQPGPHYIYYIHPSQPIRLSLLSKNGQFSLRAAGLGLWRRRVREREIECKLARLAWLVCINFPSSPLERNLLYISPSPSPSPGRSRAKFYQQSRWKLKWCITIQVFQELCKCDDVDSEAIFVDWFFKTSTFVEFERKLEIEVRHFSISLRAIKLSIGPSYSNEIDRNSSNWTLIDTIFIPIVSNFLFLSSESKK